MAAGSLFQLALAAAAVAGFWGLGRATRRLAFPRVADDGLACAVDVAIGAWLTAMIYCAAGLTVGYRPWVGWAVFAISAGSAAWSIYRSPVGWRSPFLPKAPFEIALVVIGAVIVALAAIGAVTPPAAQDALVHHLALPKTLIKAGAFIELPFNYFSYFPAGMEMLYLYSLLIGGAGMATLLHFGFGLMTAAVMLAEGRTLGLGSSARLIAALAFLSVPTVWMEMTWAYVDLALAFFVTLAVLALLRFREERHLHWLMIAGVMLGGALTIKFTALALFGLLPMMTVLIVIEHGDAALPRLLRALIALIVPALAVSAFWLIRNTIYTGNPVFPLFVQIIPSRNPGWDPFRAQVLSEVIQRYGGTDKTVVDYVLAPLKLSFLARYGSAERYDGIVGPFFLVAVPMLAVIRRWPIEVRYLLGFGGGYFLIWLFTSQQVRYLLPALPLLALAIAAAIERLDLRRVAQTLALAIIVLNTATIAWYFVQFRYGSLVTGQVTRDDYLREKFDYYRFYEYINAHTPASSRIFLVVASNQPYYLERDYFSDSVFEDYTLRQIVGQAATPAEITPRLRELGITHLLFRPAILFGASTTPFNPEELRRFVDFLGSACEQLMTDDRFALYALR